MINSITRITLVIWLFYCGVLVSFSQAPGEKSPYCSIVDSALINNANISLKIYGAYRPARETNNENIKELLFKNPQDVLEIKIWTEIDSIAAAYKTKNLLLSIEDIINKSGCKGMPDNYFFDSVTPLGRTSAFCLPASSGYSFKGCDDNNAMHKSAYMIVNNFKAKTLTEIKYFTPKNNPQNDLEKIFRNTIYLSDIPVRTTVESAPLTLQIYDSTMVSDDYILYMGCSKCRLMDRRGNIIFSIPGNLVTFIYDKELIAANTSGRLVLFDKNLDIIERSSPYYLQNELTASPDNIIMALSRESDSINHTFVSFDNIIFFDTEGKKLKNFSLYEHRHRFIKYMVQDTNIFHFKINGQEDPGKILEYIAPRITRPKPSPNKELVHTNAIYAIPENKSEKRDSTFRKGNIILSFCQYNDSLASFLAIIDPINYNILWHYVQKDKKPMHTPSMLPNGHILVYVNSHGKDKDDFSLVEEIDPITNTVVWSYIEDFPNAKGRNGRGSCQRLPNGNTLISNNCGYIYEITPDKKIVWQVFANETNGAGKFLYRANLIPKEKLKWLENND